MSCVLEDFAESLLWCKDLARYITGRGSNERLLPWLTRIEELSAVCHRVWVCSRVGWVIKESEERRARGRDTFLKGRKRFGQSIAVGL